MARARAEFVVVLSSLLIAPAFAHAFDGLPEASTPPRDSEKAPTLTRAPELKRFVEAHYPEEAAAASITGDVGMVVDIGPDGLVQNVEIVQPAGHGFDEAALAAAKQFEFTPAELDGEPAAVRIAYTYHFVLKPPPEPVRASSAGPVTMRGRILERGTRAPIVGASVRCTNLDEVAVTDARGRFDLHPPAGACEASVVAAGYASYARHEKIVAGERLELVYFLRPREQGLFQTVVHGERDRREATRRTLTREQLENVPGSFGDPIRVIHDLPGVARTPWSGGQLAIRGAAPSDSGAYMDGVEIPLLFHFLGGPSVINPEFLDRLDFLPGGFGPRYGRAVGGIVEADTRRGDEQSAHGSFKLDLIDSAAFFEAPANDRVTVAVAARRSYVDALLPSISPNSGAGTISVLPRYWDYQARVDYGRTGDASQLTFMAFGSDDAISVAATGGQKDRDLKLGMHTNFHRMRLGWTLRSGDVTNTFSPFIGRDVTGYGADAAGAEDYAMHGTTWVGGARDELTWELGRGHKVRFGADVAASASDYGVTVPTVADYRVFPGAATGPAQDYGRQTTIVDVGLYNEWELRATRRLMLLPGVRVDTYQLRGTDRTSVDPRLSARYRLADSTVLKGGAGLFSRAPDPNQLDPQWGNPGLHLPRAFQSSLGFEQRLLALLSLDVTGFFNYRYDRAVPTGAVSFTADGTVHPEYFNNGGLGRAYGVEVLLRHEPSAHFFGWLAYTLSRSEVRVDGSGDPYQLTSLDETHVLTALGQYRFGNGWGIGARFQLASGRPTTPVVGSTYDADTDKYVPALGQRYSARTRLFQQLDVRIDREWVFERWRLGAYLEVQNVYWARNVEAVQWDYRYQQKADIPGLPILPTLGLKGSF